ncbi:MAG: VWA domain-containing protein [Thermoanaerobaculia bacterium]|nr:VWA domain-containing protein [Thermoanaerobaculia bacterium]MBP9823576.1 VWA domain-containing protein [Thermoanaerobaculia bacterium]
MPTPPRRIGRTRGRLPVGLCLWLALLGQLAPSPALPAVEPAALSQEYLAWLDEVDSILTPEERAAFLALDKDYQRDAFIERFWQARDPYPDTVRNEMRETWTARVEQARLWFGSLKEERARLFLLNGAPAARLEGQCAGTTWPLEIWVYPRSERIREDVVMFVFYRRFAQGPFRLWYPDEGLAMLMQFAPVGTSDSALLEEMSRSCMQRDDIAAALANILRRGRIDFQRVLETALAPIAPISREWVATFNSYSTDLPEGVANLSAELAIAFPGRRQSRSVMQGTLAVSTSGLTPADNAGAQSFDFQLNGEILIGKKLFDAFRYKFDIPLATADPAPPPANSESPATAAGGPAAPAIPATIPLVFERFLRPGKYTLILKLEDLNGGGFFRKLIEVEVPAVEGPVPQEVDAFSAGIFAEANAALSTLDNTIRIVPPRGELQAGLVRFDSLTTGTAISEVLFTLDGRSILRKNRPPYSVELDLGEVPRTRTLRASAFDDQGKEVAWDEIQVNASSHRFRVRLIEPRRGAQYEKSLRAEAEIEVPEDGALDRVEFFLNETLVATLYQEPFTQPIALPADGGIAYVRAVAHQVDGNQTEDLVFVNAPDNLEELDVQFVELYTTVLDRENHPVRDLEQGDFRVLEDGVPQEIARFEHLENLPIHVAILLDVSASMESNLAQAKAAALKFFESAITPKDRGALIVFNDHPLLAVKLTNQLPALAGGLAGLKAERGTALYDSVVFSLFYFNGVKGQRAILLLSDGKDEGSRFDVEETLDFARRAGIAIYTVGLNIPRTDSEVRKVLKKLAEETGGRNFFIKESTELAAIYEAIQTELRSRYLLAYQSTNSNRELRFRLVDLEVGRSGLDAKTIRGYYP